MSKLNEIFVTSINKAVTAADVMSDINAKPVAYASIAHAIAVYLQGNSAGTIVTGASVSQEDVNAGLTALQASNEKVANAINNTIVGEPWVLPYDENGIPYLNDADFADAQKVLAYQNAMTPEMEANKKAIEQVQGQAVLNEPPAPQAPPAPVAPPVAPPVATFKQVDLDLLEGYKVTFDYANNPAQLDNLYHNFTSGTSTLAEITPEILDVFLIFIQEELAKAKESLEGWKATWLTKAGLDNLISEAYQAPGATIEEYVHDGNIFWFLEYIELYNANAWLGSCQTDIAPDTLNGYVKQYFDDSTLTIANINDENVVGFIYFVQQTLSQTA